MNIKRALIKIIIICMVVIIGSIGVYAENSETVKVGWFPLEGFQEVDESGNYSGYNYEYLKKIEQYSNLRFEFVEGDWLEFMGMIQTGDIDILGNINMSDERLAVYEYSKYPMGEAHTVLLTRKDDDRFTYGDVAELDGLNVCFGAGEYKLNEMLEFENEYGFKSNHIIVDTSEDVQKELINKECDVALLSTSCIYSGFKVIGDYNPNYSYYITSKNNTELMEKIDTAMTKIKLNDPGFQYELIEKYQNSGNLIEYTKEEKEYLKDLGVIKVGLPNNSRLLSEYNEEANTFTGVTYDFLEDIARLSGIKFEYVPIKEGKNKLQGLKDGDYQMVTDVERTNSNLNNSEFMLTTSYMPNEMTLVGLENRAFETTEKLNINAYNVDQSIIDSLKDRYPSWDIRVDEDDNPFNELYKKQIDLVICNEYLADYYMQIPRNSDLTILSSNLNIEDSCIAIDESLDDTLINIINKAMYNMDKGAIMESVLNHSVMSAYKLNGVDWISNNSLKFLVILVIFIAIVTLPLKIYNIKLKSARNAAEEANRAKSEFLSRMSHDMRTPLVSVMGLADIGIEDKRDIKDVEYFKQIKKSSNYLLGLLNDILDMQKIESDQVELNLQTCKLSEIFNQVYILTKASADDKEIELHIAKGNKKLDKCYKVDIMRLTQVTINVLSNAIKYTQNGGKIVWSNRIIDEKGKLCLIQTIKDNGVGMSEGFQKILFEPFTQEVNSQTKSELGTGLGLAITKNLVSLMGGEIIFISKLGKGTQFTITIPLEKATKEEIEQYNTINTNNTTEKDLTNKKILLCEDVEINARIIKKMLENNKIIVEIAENGEIGINMAKNNKYDCILMDIRMPIVDGITATKEIRKFNKDIPIIALSANAYKEDIDLSLEAGMNAHLSKPVNRELLIKELSKYIGGTNENH